MDINSILTSFDVIDQTEEDGDIDVHTPITGEKIASVKSHTKDDVELKIDCAVEAFKLWRNVPAPKRGELIRSFSNLLRENKQTLAILVSMECGKNLSGRAW